MKNFISKINTSREEKYRVVASFKVNEVVRMSNDDMKLSVVRTMYRRYKLESMLDGTFSFIKSNNGNYIILRTA